MTWLKTDINGIIFLRDFDFVHSLNLESGFNPAPPQVKMAMSARQTMPDFHLSFNVAPVPKKVVKNRERIFDALGEKLSDCVFAEQTHSSEVAIITNEDRGKGTFSPETAIAGCDALITNAPKLNLCITVADCLPVYFFDPENRAIGLAHSGWGGTAGRIAPRTLTAMRDAFGTDPKNCRIAIGPGIGGDGYEVDDRVRDAFPEPEKSGAGFCQSGPGHWKLDLTQIVREQLLTAGIPTENISVSPWRTDANPEILNSHRRENGCPRMLAMLKLT